MPRRPLSEAARKAISEAAKARWARFRQSGSLGSPVRVGGKPGPKPKSGKRRGRPPGSKNAKRGTAPVSMSMALPRASFGGQSTGELIAMRRKIDQELADRLVRDFAG